MTYDTGDHTYSEIVGRNIKRLRLERGLSQTQVSIKSGIRENTICLMENPGNARNGKSGVKSVTVDQLVALSRAFKCGVTTLLTKHQEPMDNE